ncbi:MAG: hypothetical protein IH586_20465 [Anaerolineaceae bacterium]|nr:hypothetical protein [Anaerolineaceae bacterium]
MYHLDGCQIPGLPRCSEGNIRGDDLPLLKRIKRALAKPWNYSVKKHLKKFGNWVVQQPTRQMMPAQAGAKKNTTQPISYTAGEIVRVRSRDEIEGTLDMWKELKGCAFLEEMWQYCGTTQTVLLSMERFLDERDYKVKKCRGIVLLEGINCTGTPVFGRCDRRCYLFWRAEWLEKV